ncbi:MAG: PSD1 and planctomycete cytochrome C domain-containing protein [Pirellulaceae bacterium]|nr:PSD1 and planctomycete cytochrome C domain-containing protein [Pirellulaceae bacterium]
MRIAHLTTTATLFLLLGMYASGQEKKQLSSDFFERRIRPILVDKCYECHSEAAGERQGGLLLDRQSGWLEGGDSNRAVVPNEPETSLLLKAVRYEDAELKMPPEEKLPKEQIAYIEQWIRGGAPGPVVDLGDSEFSRLGDQPYLFEKSKSHWAFQPVVKSNPPSTDFKGWNKNPIDRFVAASLKANGLAPSPTADPRTLARRLFYDLTGMPPSMLQVDAFAKDFQIDPTMAIEKLVDAIVDSNEFGHHIARMWLDVARYADTDSFYRPDTRTPHYFPFAFTYRDYVIEAFNNDKPYDQFLKEQIAADLIGFDETSPEIAALGFFAVGPHANQAKDESLDDWIDVSMRGLMGITVACARCHDHKYEPIPTADYYALRGVFASVNRIDPLDEKRLPELAGYSPSADAIADYEAKRQAIDKKIKDASGKKAGGNNLSIPEKIKETELAELLLFHPGAPSRAMIVTEKPKPAKAFVFVRGDAAVQGDLVTRKFLKILDPTQAEFPEDTSGRKELAEKIVDPDNPLTARVMVNRVWGHLIGSYLVATPSDFGLQGSAPTHPELLDWLAADFVEHGWSIKQLVRKIVLSRVYQQRSLHIDTMAAFDPQNLNLWKANRKRLTIEELRDSVLAVSNEIDLTPRGRSAELWGEGYTHRRAIYGYINRFNLDPTLRAFDFPSPMQTQPKRDESIVALQSLFTLNSPFVIDQAAAFVSLAEFRKCETNSERVNIVFSGIFQREPHANELTRVLRFVEQQEEFASKTPQTTRFRNAPWELVVQSLLMSNEFQYVD